MKLIFNKADSLMTEYTTTAIVESTYSDLQNLTHLLMLDPVFHLYAGLSR
jgi:hypothetical protein